MAKVTLAYLQGVLGDATYNKIHRTHRISQGNRSWLKLLKNLLWELGDKSWIYKEGKTRSVYVLESASKKLSMNFDPLTLRTNAEKIAYIRGYFDAEGGIAHDEKVRFYLQFAEKNKTRLEKVRNLLKQLEIEVGTIHCPSVNKDPNYWRFYVRAKSYSKFKELIGSWHPRKQKIFSRMKI